MNKEELLKLKELIEKQLEEIENKNKVIIEGYDLTVYEKRGL